MGSVFCLSSTVNYRFRIQKPWKSDKNPAVSGRPDSDPQARNGFFMRWCHLATFTKRWSVALQGWTSHLISPTNKEARSICCVQ